MNVEKLLKDIRILDLEIAVYEELLAHLRNSMRPGDLVALTDEEEQAQEAEDLGVFDRVSEQIDGLLQARLAAKQSLLEKEID
jgi:hypothetical protein